MSPRKCTKQRQRRTPKLRPQPALTPYTLAQPGTIPCTKTRALTLHKSDGSHTNAAGGYLAGAMFYAYLYDLNPVGNSFTAGLPAADVSWLQDLAYGAWQLLD